MFRVAARSSAAGHLRLPFLIVAINEPERMRQTNPEFAINLVRSGVGHRIRFAQR